MKYTVTYLTPESNYSAHTSMTVEAASENEAANIVCELSGIRRMSIAHVRPAPKKTKNN